MTPRPLLVLAILGLFAWRAAAGPDDDVWAGGEWWCWTGAGGSACFRDEQRCVLDRTYHDLDDVARGWLRPTTPCDLRRYAWGVAFDDVDGTRRGLAFARVRDCRRRRAALAREGVATAIARCVRLGSVGPPGDGLEPTLDQWVAPAWRAPRGAALDRATADAGLAPTRAELAGCVDVGGHAQVAVRIQVAPSGQVEAVIFRSTPPVYVGLCVAGALRRARFAASPDGGWFDETLTW